MDALTYVPEIEEFYVGFEFEMLTSYGYVNFIFPNIKETHFLMKPGSTLDKLKKTISSTRVKYLDQSDIESLGFTLTDIPEKYPFLERKPLEQKYGEVFSYFSSEEKSIGTTIIHIRDINYVSIRVGVCIDETNSYYNGDILDGSFSGKIKNKSELQKVLKMVGYECKV